MIEFDSDEPPTYDIEYWYC